MIIAIVNTKGGVAKTTSSMYVAAGLARHGSVQVIDADPQGTATDWAARAQEDGDPLSFAVSPGNHASLRNLRPSTDHTVIDTAPGDPRAIDLALAAADLAIVPTSPSPSDMARVWSTLDVAGPQLPTYVLFTAVDRRAKEVEQAMAALAAEGAGYFDNYIPLRKGIRDAFGTGLGERMYNYDAVVGEILETI